MEPSPGAPGQRPAALTLTAARGSGECGRWEEGSAGQGLGQQEWLPWGALELGALHVLPHYPRSRLPPSPAEPLLSLSLQTMGGTFTQLAIVLGVLQFMVQMNDQSLKVTDENLKVADQTLKVTDQTLKVADQTLKVTDETLKVADHALMVADQTLKVADHTLKVTEEFLKQHEEQHSPKVVLMLEIEMPAWIKVCQNWWFWASAEVLLMLYGFFWLPRQGTSDYDISAFGETPAVPGRKRRRRRRKRMPAEDRDKLDEVRPPDLS
ncbi:unnamed protein product [Coccothraustes coccothraustes]